MAEELEVELESSKEVNLSEKRIKELSNKVKLTSEERDELAKAKSAIEAERDSLAKERDFYQSFADIASQYPQSKDHKDEIKAKVLAGYTAEDATVSVLAKAGKLSMSPKREDIDSPAGGSATTNAPMKGKKTFGEMNREELRTQLLDAEAKGDISWS